MTRVIKSFFWDSFGRLLLMSLLLVVTVSVLLEFVMDIRGFSGNILAEVAGSGIAILIGLLVIDKFIEYRREQQWAKVHRLTYEALSSHICDIASDVYMYFPIKDHRSMGTILEGHLQKLFVAFAVCRQEWRKCNRKSLRMLALCPVLF